MGSPVEWVAESVKPTERRGQEEQQILEKGKTERDVRILRTRVRVTVSDVLDLR